MAALVRVAPDFGALAAAHVAFEFMDRRCLRSPHDVEGNSLPSTIEYPSWCPCERGCLFIVAGGKPLPIAVDSATAKTETQLTGQVFGDLRVGTDNAEDEGHELPHLDDARHVDSARIRHLIRRVSEPELLFDFFIRHPCMFPFGFRNALDPRLSMFARAPNATARPANVRSFRFYNGEHRRPWPIVSHHRQRFRTGVGDRETLRSRLERGAHHVR